jgi:hypothetical protein
MIGGCSAAGSVDLMSTDRAAGLLALFGLIVALIVTATAAYAALATASAPTPTASAVISLLRN